MIKTTLLFISLLICFTSKASSETNVSSKNYYLFQDAVHYFEKGEQDKAQKAFLSYSRMQLTNKKKVSALLRIGEFYKSKLLYTSALSYYLEALNLSSSKNNTTTGLLYHCIGGIYYDLENNKQALRYYEYARDIFKRNNSTYNLSRSYNNIAEIYRLEKKWDLAITNYKYSQKMLKKNGDKDILAINYNNMALLYLEIEQYHKSLFYLKKAEKIIENITMFDLHASLHNSYGEYYYAIGDYDNAIQSYKKTFSYHLIKEGDNIFIMREAYKGLYKSYYKKSLFQNAFQHKNNYDSINELIHKNDLKQKLADLRHKNHLQNFKNRILFYKKINIIEKKNKTILVIFYSVLIAALLLALLVFIMRFKNFKQQTLLKLKEQEIQELELKHSRLQNEKLKQENEQLEITKQVDDLMKKNLADTIENKKRELTTATMNTINKNEILSNIKLTLNNLVLNNDRQLRPIFKQISDEIDATINVDEDWNQFKMHFDKVHADFFSILQERYPDLTPDELKLCGYLRINLSSKEIGQMLNITQVAINKRRNRLRKKLGITPDIDLIYFISKIGNEIIS